MILNYKNIILKKYLITIFVTMNSFSYAQYLGGNGIGYHSLSTTGYVSLQKLLPVNITVFLEGAYASLGNMNTTLNISLPTSSPYPEDTITVASIPSTDIVDWVLIELRDKSDSTIVLYSRSGFLKNDGSIFSVDGVSPITFPVWEDNYYITIRQRNHLSIMSSSTVKFSAD